MQRLHTFLHNVYARNSWNFPLLCNHCIPFYIRFMYKILAPGLLMQTLHKILHNGYAKKAENATANAVGVWQVTHFVPQNTLVRGYPLIPLSI